MVGYLSFLKIGPKLLKFLPGTAPTCLWSCHEQLSCNTHLQEAQTVMTQFPAWKLKSHPGGMSSRQSAFLAVLSISSLSSQPYTASQECQHYRCAC